MSDTKKCDGILDFTLKAIGFSDCEKPEKTTKEEFPDFNSVKINVPQNKVGAYIEQHDIPSIQNPINTEKLVPITSDVPNIDLSNIKLPPLKKPVGAYIRIHDEIKLPSYPIKNPVFLSSSFGHKSIDQTVDQLGKALKKFFGIE